MIVYQVGEGGAVVIGRDGEPIAHFRPGTLICGEAIEAIIPSDALPIQARMRQIYGDAPVWDGNAGAGQLVDSGERG